MLHFHKANHYRYILQIKQISICSKTQHPFKYSRGGKNIRIDRQGSIAVKTASIKQRIFHRHVARRKEGPEERKIGGFSPKLIHPRAYAFQHRYFDFVIAVGCHSVVFWSADLKTQVSYTIPLLSNFR
jgi:hypothetical protein